MLLKQLMINLDIKGVSKILKVPEVNKKNFPQTLNLVYWEDIVGETNWADIVDIKKTKTAVCCSIGWLIKQDSKSTIVMADYSFEDNGEIKQGGSYTTIPTKNILKIKKIKLQEKLMARKKKEESLQDIIDHIREDLDKLEEKVMDMEDETEEEDE